MDRLKLPLTALAGFIMLPASALAAEDISYKYAELAYVVQDVDMYEDDEAFNNVINDVDNGGGLKLEASFAFTGNMFAFGKYSSTEADFTFINDAGMFVPQGQDIKTLNLGLGFFTPLSPTMDFVGRASYMDVDYGQFNAGAQDNDVANDNETFADAVRDLNDDQSDGYAVDVGVRTQTAEWLELGGGIRYTDLNSGDDISVFANALFEINPNMGINLAADFGDALSSYQLGFRYSL